MPVEPLLKKPAPQRPPVRAYIALGANLGDAKVTVLQAAAALAALPGTQLQAVSSLYQTAALNTDSDLVASLASPDYVNAVAAIDTCLTATALLDHLQALEAQAGRERPYRNAPRTLDLDLLLYGDAQLHSARLTVPHPRMLQRAFVLVPLAEIAPDRVSTAQLEAVSQQAIEKLDHPGS